MLPREHGAWSLLLTPFAAALLVEGRVNWSVAVALVAVLGMFLVREPLVVLARQRWVWRDERAESAVARRWLAGVGVVLMAAGAILGWEWGWLVAGAMGLCAGVLTVVAVWMALRNRQRSVWLQAASCAGLTFSAVAAARAAAGGFPGWAWLVWGLCAAQGTASILVVHTRLQAMAEQRTGETENQFRRAAWGALAVLGVSALACWLWGNPVLGLAPALASAAHATELRTMSLKTRLRTVGLRAMGVSMAYSLLLVVALRNGS